MTYSMRKEVILFVVEAWLAGIWELVNSMARRFAGPSQARAPT